MSKVKLPYEVTNNLDEYIIRETGARMAKTGIKYYKEYIIADLAKYAGVTKENIKRINRSNAQPSLGVAIKIAEYFNVKVEDIFRISE